MQTQTNSNLFSSVEAQLKEQGFTIVSKDDQRPWGGFFVLDENDAEKFIENYFPGYSKEQLLIGNKLSPKILLVAPGKRLSWQYHFRRAEIWRVVNGKVAVATSDNDEEKNIDNYQPSEIIVLQKGQRHRLIGLNEWGVVAEIWQHTDVDHPSDEDDIVRLQDDFGRK
ncbi:phosphoheptose isomerase [Solitalea sp. MAHUQ-68]|uniref:Phosphoheptose isomerase n=1 Tax=Solitalea agri TaxID=2953739 RepID=A0A9X2F1G9_9SPHI|nr:phosphoheptose isomerase [Solitalea agri]MCO4292476.1 phosphoheptose isomerase [Solitalea agri]